MMRLSNGNNTLAAVQKDFDDAASFKVYYKHWSKRPILAPLLRIFLGYVYVFIFEDDFYMQEKYAYIHIFSQFISMFIPMFGIESRKRTWRVNA